MFLLTFSKRMRRSVSDLWAQTIVQRNPEKTSFLSTAENYEWELPSPAVFNESIGD